MKYKLTIGLEVHAQLKTNTKMFCECLNNPKEKKPNVNICPVCTAQPGALPVINKKAVESVIKTGIALGCRVTKNTWFERKNYFYPDLPKGYQISQYKAPINRNGSLMGIDIERIHLEEDTGRLIHKKNFSLVDFNRAGIPLMELVTEPVIHSAKNARKFCEELRLVLRYLGVSEANMEKGEMRCEANISLSKNKKLGTKVEIKNLNSFKAVERAIEYEAKRQSEILRDKGNIVQETRGWNKNKQKTFSQRIKEVAEDYRYFTEPDLPPLKISEKDIEKLKTEIPELPNNRRIRFIKEYKLEKDDVEVFTNFKTLGDYFEKIISELRNWGKIISKKRLTDEHLYKMIKLVANYLITELKKLLHNFEEQDVETLKITPENFAEFIVILEQGKISSSAAQTVLQKMFETGADPSHIIEEKDLTQISNESELEKIVERVIKNNSQPIMDYKKGKENALQFLVGQVMKLSRGSANPEVVIKILKKSLTKLI